MFYYQGFGLCIASYIDFPELFPVAACEKADVIVQIGKIPSIPQGDSFCTGRITHYVNDKEIMFTVKDIASYHISGGNMIVVHPENDHVESRTLRLFVLAGAMAAILQQRNIIPMHAAAVIKDGALTLISGRSGAGKSTTLAGLMAQKYRVFSDDITVLTGNGNATASYPMIKLWEQSMQSLNLSNRTFPVMPGMEKYGVFFHEHFDTRDYPVAKIILLKVEEHFAVKRLTGGKAFAEIVQHIYKPSFFNTPEMCVLKFRTLTQLLQKTEVYEVARPESCSPTELLSRVTALI